MRESLPAAALAALLAAACGDGGEPDPAAAIPEACNPLGGQGCMLPWPSMAYAVPDAASATGYRLAIPPEAMPVNRAGVAIDPAPFNRWDGFSAIGPMLAFFPGGVSPEGLPSHRDPAASLAPDAPIVLVDVETGERAPYFAEIDQNELDLTRAALIVRPLARLRPGSRYAVAIRDTVRGASGGPLAPPPAFAALRDGGDFDHPRFAAVAAGAPAMFDALAAAGVDRRELVLAWDFVTVSDEHVRGDLTAMRAQALPLLGAGQTFTAVAQPPTPRTHRRYLGTFQSPDFLTDGEADASVLRRDAAHRPVVRGMRDARFAAIVPRCVETQPLPRPTIVFGHGLFGSAEGYLSDGFVEDLAESRCFVIVAGDFIGLSERELRLVTSVIPDLGRSAQIADKLAQSIIDFIALETIVRGPMAAAPEFRFGGAPVIDPARTYYVGGSLGGIMGNTFLAYDPNLTRGVLAVPGGNWSMLLERSTAWGLLSTAHRNAYRDPPLHQLTLALALGMGLEPVDPLTTAAHVTRDPLFGQAPKQVLIWYAIGDSLVTNISTEMIAREMQLPLLGPSVKVPWGLAAAAGAQPSGITVYDDHPSPLPYDTNQPREDNGTHSGINRKPAAMRQVEQFLLPPFSAVNACRLGGAPAPCDCATGACD